MSIAEMTECGSPITVADLDRVEAELGVELPEPYRQFLLKHNGGQPTPDAFPFKGKADGSIVNFFYSVNDPVPIYNLSRAYADWSRRVAADLLPVAVDAGGSLVCLGIRGDRNGKVYFWSMEDEADPPDASYDGNVWLVSDTFEDFVESFRDS